MFFFAARFIATSSAKKCLQKSSTCTSSSSLKMARVVVLAKVALPTEATPILLDPRDPSDPRVILMERTIVPDLEVSL